MADFPTSVFEPRTTANKAGTTYAPEETTVAFAEDYSLPAAEIVAIEETLGTDPQGAYETVKDWLEALATAVSTIVTAFTGLSDVPASYTGAANKVVAVKGDESGLEFISVGGGAATGTITLWPTGTAPTGYLLCDGSQVSRATYSALFSLIGTTYGVGDGSTTFNLPNFKGRVPVGFDSGQTEFDALAETGGAKTHTLTTGEMPAHTHGYNIGYSSSTGDGTYTNNFDQTSTAATNPNNTTSEGGGGAHNNLQPYLVVNFIIKT